MKLLFSAGRSSQNFIKSNYLKLQMRVFESQRDSAAEPRVARDELPWVKQVKYPTTPTGLRKATLLGFPLRNPFGVEVFSSRVPRVARSSQPWALLRNPFGIGRRYRKSAILIGTLLCFALHLCSAQPNVDLQKPPAELPKDFPKLSPLLTNDDGKEITTKRDWEKQREKIKAQWLDALGGLPKKRAPLKTEFLEKENLGTFTRQYVRYQIEDGIFTDGYLLTPKNAPRKSPAIVVFHGTTPLQAKGVAGLAPDYAEEKWFGTQLVQRGYVVWCPRNYIFDEGTVHTNGVKLYTANAEWVKHRHPTWTGMTRMVFDAIRAADFVESLPNVDSKRIGCIGHSLGGKCALYAAAFDTRYKAAVSSEGGIGLRLSNWDAIWYLGPAIKDPTFRLENHEVLSFVAPRPFLLLSGQSSDNDRSWAFIDAVRPIYKLYGEENNVGWFDHRQGHRYSPQAREVAEAFLDHHLKP